VIFIGATLEAEIPREAIEVGRKRKWTARSSLPGEDRPGFEYYNELHRQQVLKELSPGHAQVARR
jgi:hypothetical protein